MVTKQEDKNISIRTTSAQEVGIDGLHMIGGVVLQISERERSNNYQKLRDWERGSSSHK